MFATSPHENGYVKLFRSITHWEWFTNSEMLSIFIYLLVSANHKDGHWRGQLVKRGQLITGRKSISKATRIHESNVYRCLERLQSTNEIAMKPNNKYSLITICNYDSYQSNESTTEQQMNNKRTTNEHKQEYKEGKEDIKDIVEQARPVIDHLNKTAKTSYRPETVITNRLISNLLKKGYTLKDFEIVHAKKVKQWQGDEKMQKFIRPQTLYAESNFESYLNEKDNIKIGDVGLRRML